MRYQHEGTYGEVTSLPGCSQVAVSHSVFRVVRDTGRGKENMQARLQMMFDELGYDYVICTVDMTNARQKNILEATGWRELDTFGSSKTGHFVEIWGRAKVDKDPVPITPPPPLMSESERETYDAWEKSISRPLPVDVDYYSWFNGAE